MISAYVLLIVLTFFGAVGSFYFKKASQNCKKIRETLKNKNFYWGAGFYFISAVLNIIVLQMLPYTIVLPCSAITYVWSLFLSYAYLGEKVGFMKIAGVSCIIIGTLIIPLSLLYV
jgi:drug/metabolite transporter (DMT)-like permease